MLLLPTYALLNHCHIVTIRFWCREVCRFKSCHPYQQKPLRIDTLAVFFVSLLTRGCFIHRERLWCNPKLIDTLNALMLLMKNLHTTEQNPHADFQLSAWGFLIYTLENDCLTHLKQLTFHNAKVKHINHTVFAKVSGTPVCKHCV